MTDDSSDISEDIVPDVPQHTLLAREFFPWHKVRKEFIRKEQWNKFIVRYAQRYLRGALQDAAAKEEWTQDSENGIPDSTKIDRPLKCLVIPGDDLLDIRSLYRDTEDIRCFIRYLGFNSGQGSQQVGTRVHIAHNDVTSLPRISAESQVVHGPFQLVANQQSQAYKYLKQLGPFHVINLDLCDSLFPNKSGDIESNFNGLHGISAYQMKEMATPWLLFITTEVAPGEVDTEQFDRLCRPTKINIRSHDDFEAALSSLMPTAAVNVPDGECVDCSRLSEQQLIDLFGVALGKALLSFCASADETWKVQMLGSHIYSINPAKSVSMLSLAFQFSPIVKPPADATGISSLQLDQPTPFDELELATKLVEAVKKIRNVDSLLQADTELHARLFQSSAQLLASAGYDYEAYVEWVQNGEPT